jgi:hypothetical protein
VVKVDDDDAEVNVNVEDEDEEEKENHEYQQQRRKRAKGQALARGRAKNASGSMARRGSINGRRGEGYDSPAADDAAHFPTGETDSSKEVPPVPAFSVPHFRPCPPPHDSVQLVGCRTASAVRQQGLQ